METSIGAKQNVPFHSNVASEKLERANSIAGDFGYLKGTSYSTGNDAGVKRPANLVRGSLGKLQKSQLDSGQSNLARRTSHNRRKSMG